MAASGGSANASSKEHKPELYMELALNGSLHEHLAEINKEAMEQIEFVIVQLAKAEGVTEALKASNQLEWIANNTITIISFNR